MVTKLSMKWRHNYAYNTWIKSKSGMEIDFLISDTLTKAIYQRLMSKE